MHKAHLAEHRHPHVFLGEQHGSHVRQTWMLVALTVAMMVVEIVAGHMTGSLAPLVDGWHMATHAGALGLSAFAYWFACRHARDERYAFGTGKVGDLAGLSSPLLLALCRFASPGMRLTACCFREPLPMRKRFR